MFEKENTLRKDGKSGIKKGQLQKKTILKQKLGVVTFEDLVDNSYKILKDAQKSETRLQNGMPLKVDVAKSIAKISKPRDINITGDINLNITVQKFID